nr:lysophospholipid acyltransferase family protein [Aliikangiella sp. G2MR2-5]
MQFVGIFNFDLNEAENFLAVQKGKVIVANHPSLIDVVVLISIIPHADCVVKKDLWQNFFLKGVVKAADYIKNDENPEELLAACQKSLNQGFSLIIFPEGTRTKPGMPLKLQRGASNIALRCKADLVPVVIDCFPTTLTKNEPWYSIPDKKAEFSIKVKNLISVTQFLASDSGLSLAARKLTEEIKKRISRESNGYA